MEKVEELQLISMYDGKLNQLWLGQQNHMEKGGES